MSLNKALLSIKKKKPFQCAESNSLHQVMLEDDTELKGFYSYKPRRQMQVQSQTVFLTFKHFYFKTHDNPSNNRVVLFSQEHQLACVVQIGNTRNV